MNARKWISGLLKTAASTALVLGLSAAVPAAAEGPSKKDLSTKALAALEESASSTADFERLAQLYGMRAEMLREKAQKHDKLEQRYASAPKSLIAKRGHGWNTPKRQAILAENARRDAEIAERASERFLARAEGLATEVD